jgi:hypothetical protein
MSEAKPFRYRTLVLQRTVLRELRAGCRQFVEIGCLNISAAVEAHIFPAKIVMPVARNGPLSFVLLPNPPTTTAVGKCVLYFLEKFRVPEGLKKKGCADLCGDRPDREIVTACYDDEASFWR